LPLETIQCLLNLEVSAQFIHGNGDREVLARMSGYETDWYRAAPEQCASRSAGPRSNYTPSISDC